MTVEVTFNRSGSSSKKNEKRLKIYKLYGLSTVICYGKLLVICVELKVISTIVLL